MKNMKKIAFILFALCGMLYFQGCQLDNYDGPNATLVGQLLDAETNEPMPTQYQNGAKIRLYEYYDGQWSPQPNDFWVKQDGTFENRALFAGKYRIIAEGAFAKQDTIETDISGTKALEIKVNPYLRMTIDASASGDAITLSTRVSRSSNAPKIKMITFLAGKTPYVDKSTFVKKTDKDVSAMDDSEIISKTFTETLSELTRGATYYVRIGALAENAANDYNYSTIVKIDLP